MKKNIIFILLAVLTIACHTYVEQYAKSGSEMLTENWVFHAPAAKSNVIGRAEKKGNAFFLLSTDKHRGVSIHQNIPSFEPGTKLELSADMKYENILPGKKSWNRARLLLVQNDGKKNRWDLPNLVASFTGTGRWKRYGKVFTVSPVTKKLIVIAQLSRCTGAFQLKNIHLFPVAQTRTYIWVKKSILTIWGVFFVFLLGSCLVNGRKSIVLRVVLVLSFMAIIIGTTMPGAIKAQVLKEVTSKIHMNHFLPWTVSQVGHFCFFALFGFILSIFTGRGSFIHVALNTVLIAGGTELAQSFIDGRTPLIVDFLIDSAGGGMGMLLYWLYAVAYDVWHVRRHEAEGDSVTF